MDDALRPGSMPRRASPAESSCTERWCRSRSVAPGLHAATHSLRGGGQGGRAKQEACMEHAEQRAVASASRARWQQAGACWSTRQEPQNQPEGRDALRVHAHLCASSTASYSALCWGLYVPPTGQVRVTSEQ